MDRSLGSDRALGGFVSLRRTEVGVVTGHCMDLCQSVLLALDRVVCYRAFRRRWHGACDTGLLDTRRPECFPTHSPALEMRHRLLDPEVAC